MKCQLCDVIMIIIKIDYREPSSTKTSRKPIGFVCPICNRLQFNQFWEKLKQRKESEKNHREQKTGHRKKPRFRQRFPCFRCRFAKPILRKLPITEKHPTPRWKGTCPKCGDVWTQNHPD